MQGCRRSFSRENAKRNRRIIFSHNSLNTALSGCASIRPTAPVRGRRNFASLDGPSAKPASEPASVLTMLSRVAVVSRARFRWGSAMKICPRRAAWGFGRVRAASVPACARAYPPSLVPSRPAAGLSVSPEIPDVTLLRSSRSQRSSRFPALQSLTRQPNKLRTMCVWSHLRVQRRPALLGEQVPGNLSLLRP